MIIFAAKDEVTACGRIAFPHRAPTRMTNLPNLLTLSRIAVLPLLVAAFYLPGDASSWATLAIFGAAGITDYLDGRIARARNLQSALGRFLDPLADKMLVVTTILMLVAVGIIHGPLVIAGLIILLREFLISGLREFLGQVQVSVPVSHLAKRKTTIQIIAIALLLVDDAADSILPAGDIGAVALWVAAALTLYTGLDYLRAGRRHLSPSAEPPPASPGGGSGAAHPGPSS